MIKPEKPKNEDKRLQSLCSLNILDTLPEERFDRFTRIAKRHFGVSIALVSLVDAERQWFKSRQGLDASETPRDISFCGHAILKNGIFNISDTLEDIRFADNPLVTGPPNIRFYAGAPIHAPNGQAIGTLCIIDDKPREFSAEDLVVLRDLANGVEEELKHSKIVAKSIQRHVYPISVISMILGSLLSLLLFMLASQIEEDQITFELQTLVEERSVALATELESVEDVMHGVAGLYAASSHVEPSEFSAYLARAFLNKKDIHSAAWIEHTPANKIENIYQQAAKDGYQDFQLREFNANKKLIKATPRQTNNIIYHLYSHDQEQWFPRGLNLSALPIYDALLKQTSLSGEIVSIKNDIHSENHSGSKALELFMPVYQRTSTLNGDGIKKKKLRGYIGLLLDAGDTVKGAYKRYISKAGGLDMYIVNADSRRSREVLYFHASRARSAIVDPLPIAQVERGRFVSTDIEFADTRWRIVLRPIPGRYETGKAASPWLALGIGFLFTLMIAGYLNTLQRRRSDIEQQVSQRTEELNNSRERIRAVIDTVVDGIVTIDAQGIVQSFNPAAERIFGYTADEVIDRNVKILMPAPYTLEHDGYLHNYLTTGIEKVIGIGREVVGKRKDDSTFPMELSVSEMRINDERMFTGIVRDITERKKVERMKSEFISTVSHELRTPLTSIRGALGLVLGKAAGQLPDKMRNMLEMANRNSERLTLLINDILDLEKIESGLLEFEFNPVDLVALARQAVADNDGYASQHGAKLILNTSLEQAPMLGNDHRLLQVFANLISNAVKYSPENGTVEVSVIAHESGYRVSVRDYGLGIPEEFHSSIFQRFAQADSSDTREKGGTGLGLSITKAIVEHHHGRIDYDTEQGKGTVFYFDLPVAQPAIRESKKATSTAQVLICEDNPNVAEILTEMLKTENIGSDIAATAEVARSLLAKNTYALMLLDLNLPDIDGLVFLKELRTIPATMELPIIVISGRATEGRAEFTGDAMMVVDWIQKPIDQKQLERVMKEALRRKVRPRILHVEDDLDIVQVTQVLLDDIADVTHEATVKGSRERLSKEEFDLVILDLGLTDGSGLELLDELKGRCPIVIFSAQNPDREVSAQVTAALTKSMTSNARLLATIKDALQGTIQGIKK